MTEKLALQQGLYDGRAVHGDEIPAPPAVAVDQASDYLFARPGFTRGQDVGRATGAQGNLFAHGEHGGAAPAKIAAQIGGIGFVGRPGRSAGKASLGEQTVYRGL
jgi:hypothetical protein